jgi:hypothetical protein
MTLDKLYTYINFVLNRDSLGEPMSPANYNILIATANENYYNTAYNKVLELSAAKGIDLSTKLFNHTALFRFLSSKNYEFGNIIPELAPLPDDLGYTIAGRIYYNNIWRVAAFLDTETYSIRRYNIIGPSVKRHPIFTEKTNGYAFVPRASRKAIIDYLRKVITPFYDYCIGVDDDNQYYMPVGSYIKTEDDIMNLYGADNGLIVSNVIHLSNLGVTYFSKSVELFWCVK